MNKEDLKILSILILMATAPLGIIMAVCYQTPTLVKEHEAFLQTCSIQQKLKLIRIRYDGKYTSSTFVTLREEERTYKTSIKAIVAHLEDNDYNKENCDWFDSQRINKHE